MLVWERVSVGERELSECGRERESECVWERE